MHLMIRFLAVLAVCFLVQLRPVFPQQPGAAALRTEYLEDPVGLDTDQPRFTWQLNDGRREARQSAYRILVNPDSGALLQGKGTMWDSQWVQAADNLVTYAGKPLQPFTRYFWRVDITGKDQKPGLFAIAAFETGMMDMQNWKGAWISDRDDIHLKPAPCFRTVFDVKRKIRSARAYIAVAGLYELYLNGRKVGNHRLDPMYTRFDRRTLYVTYDVTGQLQPGKNALGVLLGNGWYNHQSTAVWNFHTAGWRARPAFCLDLRITYEDGTTEIISSGKDWKTALSAVTFNSIYTAEHYDARLEQPGWNTTNFTDTAWKQVVFRAAPSAHIVAQALHPIRNVEEIAARSLQKFSDTVYVFNLGRNISGVSRITVSGEPGTVVRLKHGERLYKNGRVDLSNIDVHYRPTDDQDPFQTDIFTLSGKGEESFMPLFNYKGFQYVEVTCSRPLALKQESLTGFFMHSDVPVVGSVSSSDPVINNIWSATNHSYLSNLFGYPTDCPQREKNGWTGDAQIAIETGLYSFDGITVYEKWLADQRDEQQPNGVLPAIVPTSGWGYEWANGPDWTSTIAIIPWNIYLFYGDKKLLTDCYDNIKRYVNHIDENYPSGVTSWGLGDWVPVKSKTPVELTSTCYYYTDVSILASAAQILGKPDDYTRYTALAAKIKRAFNDSFYHRETGLYANGTQTALSVALYWKLVPGEHIRQVAANLAKRVAADSFHLDVGLLGQKAILNALSENGYTDIAYRIAAQRTYPSWGWWIQNGATTLYENWNLDSKNDISLNHIMFGEIGAWLYKGPAGIRPDPLSPGFKHVLLQPAFVAGLDHFEASHTGPYGKIVSAWKRTKKGYIYTAIIPANSTATVVLPAVSGRKASLEGKAVDGDRTELPAGTWEFVWK